MQAAAQAIDSGRASELLDTWIDPVDRPARRGARDELTNTKSPGRCVTGPGSFVLCQSVAFGRVWYSKTRPPTAISTSTSPMTSSHICQNASASAATPPEAAMATGQ